MPDELTKLEDPNEIELTSMDEWLTAVFTSDAAVVSKEKERNLSDAVTIARESLARLTSRPT